MLKKLLFALVVALLPLIAFASSWMGFDAQTTDLVEVTPIGVPQPGENIVVHNLTTASNTTCLVRAVNINSMTIEISIITSTGEKRMLVMESL